MKKCLLPFNRVFINRNQSDSSQFIFYEFMLRRPKCFCYNMNTQYSLYRLRQYIQHNLYSAIELSVQNHDYNFVVRNKSDCTVLQDQVSIICFSIFHLA